jgi:hypothetical protein
MNVEFSVVESCRRLGLPIRDYRAAVLPGIANRSIQSLAQLTPAAYAAARLGNLSPDKPRRQPCTSLDGYE